MLRHVQRVLSSASRWQQFCQDRCLHTTPPAASFQFASAVSSHGNLYIAIQECIDKIEQLLPLKDIHLCQLLVSTKHASKVSHAPHCLIDNLQRSWDHNNGSHDPPVIIGGALKSVCGRGRMFEATPGVSVLAASLPGVELMPFHVDDASLPPFTAEQWQHLLQTDSKSTSSSSSSSGSSSSSNSSSDGCAAIVFSAPHFTEVESFLQRLTTALPNVPVVGGVTERDAWIDTEHKYGALFCGSDVFCNGAVGVVMRGPLVLKHIVRQSGRPAGNIMTVTEAAGNVILALDNHPVHESFVTLLHSLPKADQKRELLLGINDSTTSATVTPAGDSSRQFVARAMHLTSTGYGRPVLAVAADQVPVGARVQLLVRDYDVNYQHQQQSLTAMAEQLPLSAMNHPQQMALLSYCCVALPHSEGAIAADVLPQVPFAGGRMQGEFASARQTGYLLNQEQHEGAAVDRAVAGAKLHSYAASFALLHHQDMLTRTD